MPRFTANLSLLFTEVPLLERFAEAARAGFTAVEIQFPYDEPASAIREAADAAGVDIILINVPAGDLMQGGPGLACVPGREGEYRQALSLCLEYAQVLEPRCVNVLAGRLAEPERRRKYYATFHDNLARSADALAGLGIRAVFEAVNTFDMPGFLIHDTVQMGDVLGELDHPNLAMQYDVYHMSRMGEDLLGTLAELAPHIGHIQIADDPGRGQPGSGALDYAAIFRTIDASAYEGWIGAEYLPRGPTRDSLDWFAPYAAPA